MHRFLPNDPRSRTPNPIFRQAGPDRSNDSHDGTDHDQEPVQSPLLHTYFITKELQIERQRQDDTYSKTQSGTHQGHNAVERRDEDGDNENYYYGCDPNGAFQQTSRPTR